MNSHPEQWAANAAAPAEQLGVRCLAQGFNLSRGIEGGEKALVIHSPPTNNYCQTCDSTCNLQVTSPTLYPLGHDCLEELLSHYSPSCALRSCHLVVPRISKPTVGGRSFSYFAPKLWNNLPNTAREADTLCQFKSRLKTCDSNLAYT